jgi:hypothetical protein
MVNDGLSSEGYYSLSRPETQHRPMFWGVVKTTTQVLRPIPLDGCAVKVAFRIESLFVDESLRPISQGSLKQQCHLNPKLSLGSVNQFPGHAFVKYIPHNNLTHIGFDFLFN